MHCKLFTTPFCPNCPAVKLKMQELSQKIADFTSEYIDASQPAGLDQAKQYKISHVPTAILFQGDQEIGRGHSVGEVDNLISQNIKQ